MYTVYIRALDGSYINVDQIIQIYATIFEDEEYIMAMSSYETADPILDYTGNKDPDQLILNALSMIANAKIESQTIGDVVIVDLA
ncbi:hypothetical protein [Methanolobus profundi]|uniref:Uncharacterized protein n=1 Tax=Methanolobus profundi TaxID=487685 RepID=A0A1I4R5C8_9EURY|nr:hypothetical protein [Methanolobus profundi]SFM47518.1 hypothetical protein SAMN04488696_1374 [Methanolobus profundi]